MLSQEKLNQAQIILDCPFNILTDKIQQIKVYYQQIACNKLMLQQEFNGCEKLKTIDLPLTQYIGEWAFNGCKKLKTIYAPNLVTIHEEAIGGAYSKSCTLFVNDADSIKNQLSKKYSNVKVVQI